ncbi:MAG: nickel pincer cofactor biosynthesis protein LarC [Spirochaetes bacterium]|nr:nickel pincer cofactor biosynthesis protein LarC [Spirochaetota bacterium]
MGISKRIFFDISFGASGDMLLASLIDAGLSIEALKNSLSTLPIHGWDIDAKKIVKYNFSGTALTVSHNDKSASRNLAEILSIIDNSALSANAKAMSKNAFTILAQAEAAVHGTSIENVHFHEVGAIDSIIDIIGFSVAMDILGIDEIMFGDVPFTQGSIHSSHGMLPVPAPAVIELAKGLRVIFAPHRGEIVTPTAMAVLRAVGSQITNNMTSLALIAHGIGFGTREYDCPSFTRAFILQDSNEEGDFLEELICVLDDLNPQCIPYVSEKLFAAGARDVYFSQIIMKKGRPGVLLTVLCDHHKREEIKNIIFLETTTIGIRQHTIWREKLTTSFKEILLEGHRVRMKISHDKNAITNIMPEYEDVKKVAEITGIPLRELLRKAIDIFNRTANKQ